MESAESPITIATVNAARLAYQEFGTGTGPVIILVAGGASSMDWWDHDFCRQLAAGDSENGPRRVIRYDLRDTGQSETVPPGEARYTGSDLVDDLAGLIEHLHAAPAHVVGLSMGGALLQRLAQRRPELLASITLMSTTAIGSGPADAPALPPPTAKMSAALSSPTPDPDWTDATAVGTWFVETELLYSGTLAVDEARLRRIAEAVRSRTESPASSGNHWMIDQGTDETVDVTTIAIPTLVIHGSADPMFPLPHGERLAELIPGARLVVVPGMGHQNPPPPAWDQIVAELLAHTA
ncbi:alpha/beta fold hydrolase [Glaciihabitans sp. dw_435]|uniref:alpha/beta fold hydrolase n=1 Tax=Glaciihabitans sp. dw_435 TaxID=2720081 RepID=UPI001BD64736|nr:alpha/beta hydrolase [Glaciihabitans sp. dw_435]